MTTTNNTPWKLWYKQPGVKWEEALPIGNGRLGGMVFGGIEKERIQLNEDTLWSGSPKEKINGKAFSHLQKTRELIFEGNYHEAEQLIEAKMVGSTSEAYQPLGDLYIEHHLQESPKIYRRELDLNTGIAITTYKIGETKYTREAFVSFPDQVLAVRFQSDNYKPIDISIYLDSPLHHTYEE
jgi:alpha-L-fucosidase 2